MNITTYFLKHPVIALVLNAMILIVGIVCFDSLPMREYPEVHFPKVQVIAQYPNASAELVESSVTNILEDKLAGVEGIETIKSESTHGSNNISISFKNGTSIDRALLSIREAISLAQLPLEINPPVVQRKTEEEGIPFMAVSLESSNMDFAELTHYANVNLKNIFRSINGVASAEIWGQPYTYNILLDEQKLYIFGVNTDEVFDALKRGNLSLPVGKFQNDVSATLNSELKTLKDFENLIVKEKHSADPKIKSQAVLLKDVASIKLQTDDQNFRVRINGKPGLSIGIQKANDANPLEVSALVHARLDEVQKTLPEGVKMSLIIDKAEFIRHSISNIKSSIVEAVIFVLLITCLFLRNIKATIVPLVTIPISLVGSLLFLKMFGFSINIMTLLAMVMAVGLVVDDAIIVLENIHRHIENGSTPTDAALKGAKEIGFAIVAMTLTLTSVYAPLAFISGFMGQLFAEFAVALAGSVLISGVVALTLSPLMCTKALRIHQNVLWPAIDRFLDRLTHNYISFLSKFLLHKKTCMCIFIGALGISVMLAQMIPGETTPKEDRSLVGAFIPLIPGKNIDTMEQKMHLVEDLIKVPEAQHKLLFMGSFGGYFVLPLVPQSERSRSAKEIEGSMWPVVSQIPSLDVWPWSWDSGLPGVDIGDGASELSMVVTTTDSYENLYKTIEKARQKLGEHKIFASLRHDLKMNTAHYNIDLDVNEMAHLGLNARQVAKAIEVFFSGDQSLNFAKDGVLYKVTLKGRQSPWSLNELYITNKFGERISLGVVAKLIPGAVPDKLNHYNQMRAVKLTIDLSMDQAVGEVMQDFYRLVSQELPESFKKIWSGNAKTYGEARRAMATLFLLALVFIFAILSVQFENFTDPGIILLTVPLACLGGLGLVWATGGSLNIYTQIGLITLIGLITKHGILIVEFANQLGKDMDLNAAITKAASLRLRPILMTTGAMIFGSIPLILSSDAGHEAQRAIGIVLVGGLSFGTFFTLFMLPTIYYLVKSLQSVKR